jgi:hypothetical protein
MHDSGMLPSFLGQLIQMGMGPDDETVFNKHLEPLGLCLSHDTDEIHQVSARTEGEQRLQSELKELLENVNGAYPGMLEGAWQAFYSDSKDKYRQALVSCRELLNDVLETLGDGEKVKEAAVEAEKPEGKRKIWVREILGSGRESEIVTESANLISSLYGMESSLHGEPDSSRALFALTETEHILYFLLTHRSDKKQKAK